MANSAKLLELLTGFLEEDEQPGYDPKTGVLFALKEGQRRELMLPEDIKQNALRAVRQPIYG
jgi:hypothetical protein